MWLPTSFSLVKIPAHQEPLVVFLYHNEAWTLPMQDNEVQ